MSIKQICKQCESEMKLTEITTDTGKKVWAYMCICDEMVRKIKEPRQNERSECK